MIPSARRHLPIICKEVVGARGGKGSHSQVSPPTCFSLTWSRITRNSDQCEGWLGSIQKSGTIIYRFFFITENSQDFSFVLFSPSLSAIPWLQCDAAASSVRDCRSSCWPGPHKDRSNAGWFVVWFWVTSVYTGKQYCKSHVWGSTLM